MGQDLHHMNGLPPPGRLPDGMNAQLIRPERYGEPTDAFRMEFVDLPPMGPRDILLAVMAAGVNYNGVWAARATPVDLVAMRLAQGESERFHIAGSDASGIVWKVGTQVTRVREGDHVVIDANVWDPTCPWVLSGHPTLSPTARVLGYEVNWGTFAQFALVGEQHCHPKPPNLSWIDSATIMASAGPAHRMLHGWPPNQVRRGDVVLVWGGAGGLGCMAIQVARASGAVPIAVVSSPERAEFCLNLGAAGVIDRGEFHHWGPMPPWRHSRAYATWLDGVRAFGERIWNLLGERVNPAIVVEHPGQDTIPTSLYVCRAGGMVVNCGGTSGYDGSFDLRHLWMRQKRIQGSHMYDARDARAVLGMAASGQIKSCVTRVFPLDQVGLAHQLLDSTPQPMGKMAVTVGCSPTEATIQGNAQS